MEVLLDAWERPPVRSPWSPTPPIRGRGAATTLEIIRRIYELTTTPFRLTIVDNDSDEAFRRELAGDRGRNNASLVLLDRNVHWGPALNIGLRRCAQRVPDLRLQQRGLRAAARMGARLHRGTARPSRRRNGRPLVSSPAFATGARVPSAAWFRRLSANKSVRRSENPNRRSSTSRAACSCSAGAAYRALRRRSASGGTERRRHRVQLPAREPGLAARRGAHASLR